MAVTYNVVYKGRENTLSIQLSNVDEAGVVTNPDLIVGNVTKVELLLKGKYYCSEDYPTSFDYTTEGADGIITMKLGIIPDLEVVKDARAEIITYDPGHPSGLVWGTMPIQVIQLIGIEADE